MKCGYLLLSIALLVAACSSASQVTLTTAPPTLVPTGSPTADVEVSSWVNRPDPTLDQVVTIYGTIRAKGVYRNGVTMTAVWPDDNHARGVPNCWVRTSYELGICTVEAADFTPGDFVPVTITFEFDGVKYTTQTGFTPHGE